MNEDQRRVAQQKVWAADLHTLRRHLPTMQTSQLELSHSAGQLHISQGSATRVYAWYGLNALADLHALAMQALVREQDFSSQVLAKDAIQLAVNVMYVLGDAEGDRLTGALRHLLDAQSVRFTEWQIAVPEHKEAAAARAAKLATDCRQSPWYADAPAWPSLGVRADMVGVGLWVHPIFAGAANAEQTMAQELINFLECERGSPPARQAAHAYLTARCASDALYVSAVALHLFALALHRMASVLQDKVAMIVAESAIERMGVVIAEHHRLAGAHRDDNNIYIGIPSNR